MATSVRTAVVAAAVAGLLGTSVPSVLADSSGSVTPTATANALTAANFIPYCYVS